LAGLNQLESLYLHRTLVTGVGVKELKKALPEALILK
jgi:hypothetical protein